MFFYDLNYLKVGKYLKIISIDNNCVVIFMRNKSKLSISGSDLELDYYDKEEINIKGSIKRIEIEYENN